MATHFIRGLGKSIRSADIGASSKGLDKQVPVTRKQRQTRGPVAEILPSLDTNPGSLAPVAPTLSAATWRSGAGRTQVSNVAASASGFGGPLEVSPDVQLYITLPDHGSPGPSQPKRAKGKRNGLRHRLPPAHANAPLYSHEVLLSDSDDTTSPKYQAAPTAHPRPLLGSNFYSTLLLFTTMMLVANLPTLLQTLPHSMSTHIPAAFLPSWLSFPRKIPPASLTAALASSNAGPLDVQPPPPSPFKASKVRVAVVVPRDTSSPLGGTPWGEVMTHLASRFSWTDPDYAMQVIYTEDLMEEGPGRAAAISAFDLAQIVTGVGVDDLGAVNFLSKELFSNKRAGQTVLFLDSASELHRKRVLGGKEWSEGGESSPLQQLLPWLRKDSERRAEVVSTVQELWGRADSENMLFAFLVLVHEYVQSVPAVKSSAKGMDLQSLVCIVRHCFSQVKSCVQDPTCKGALDCLNACSFNDQVCQYRCIVSYETPQLEAFSLCILQLHNCRRLSATPPALPDPVPLPTFQGQPMTHEAAEKVLRGWLGESDVSWLVAAGKNPAYDYFPCQHQLFFPGKARGAHWYEPVFKVKTLDGGEVWRRRRYRVRRAQLPGTFRLTVLDNGVTSNEFWRLLDAADDLSFSLFYYSGAASAAGLAYSGAVLATPDGAPPAAEHMPRIESALSRAGIKLWELSSVDNSECSGAPLELSNEAKATMAAIAAAG